jgi:hypothetical protein
MDRDEIALILQLAPSQVRIVPTACGGGFGGKLDLSVQPLIALAAWRLERPVACVWSRTESMMASTKRHPSRIRARFGADADGRLQAVDVDAVFDTGAYASWGPTVANRVPIHATGPYAVPHVATRGRAILTNGPVGGAFRGFGVPQVAIAHETLMDDLATRLGIDRLELRRRNALRVGDTTATGQRLDASCGLVACLDALEPRWLAALAAVDRFNATSPRIKRGVGLGCMWYGIGNTALSNPSSMRVALAADGTITFFNGCADIGQGTTTTMLQVVADAVGLPMDRFRIVTGDTDATLDAGKSSASRQAFVSGKASELAGRALRERILALVGADDPRRIAIDGARSRCATPRANISSISRRSCRTSTVMVIEGIGRFDPPTTPLDAGRPGRALRDVRVRRADGGGRGRSGSRHDARAEDRRGARRRPRAESAAGRGADPRRRRAGPRPRADGGIRRGPHREPARLPDPDDRRRATDRDDPRRGPRTARPRRRERRRRTRADPDAAGDPRRDPPRDRRADDRGAGAAASPARGAAHSDPITDHMRDDTSGIPRRLDQPVAAGNVRCDACPVLCIIRPGKTGACDRYANVDGRCSRASIRS